MTDTDGFKTKCNWCGAIQTGNLGDTCTTCKREGLLMDVSYDINNNCVVCDAYVYDQHKTTCPHYVKEKLTEFHARIQATICGDCLIPLNQCQHAKEYKR